MIRLDGLRVLLLSISALTLLACGAGPAPADPAVEAPSTDDNGPAAEASPAETAPPPTPRRRGIAPATISDEGGDANGVVVLWPRVIPSATADKMDNVAIGVQTRMSGVASTALPGRTITLRPKPERSCPQAGCAGLSLGVLLAHVQKGCAAAALIGAPGRSPRRIVPWAGRLELKALQYDFRGHPESLMTIKELVPCDDLVRAMGERDAAVAEALKFAARAHLDAPAKAP